nr:nopaline transport system permease protein nocM, putative [Tanacetum cinerariifolium]
AEVYRGAYLAVAKGELEAALAIGMTWHMRVRRVLIPQVWRYALPGLGNVWQMTLKDSALISVIGLPLADSQLPGSLLHLVVSRHTAVDPDVPDLLRPGPVQCDPQQLHVGNPALALWLRRRGSGHVYCGLYG